MLVVRSWKERIGRTSGEEKEVISYFYENIFK